MQNKRVLIVIPKFPVVTETFIKREVVRLLERQNYKYKVFVLERGNGDFPPELEDYLSFQKLSISDVLKGLRFLVTDPVNVYKSLKTVGFDHFYIFLKGIGFAHKFSKFDPDLIYTHFFSDFSSITLVASIILDTEYAIAAHARDILEYPDLPKQKVKNAKFIAVCNDNAYKDLIRQGGVKDPENVHLIYHGLNPDDLEIPEEIEKVSPPLILCIGRYVKKKGLTYLIEAAAKLKDSGKRFQLKIAGGGPLHKTLQERINELGLQNEVKLLGKIPFGEIKKLYYMTSIYVQPSINAESGDADGIPNTLIESAMSKIPIVTTDAGSILDFLDEESANIVPQRDSVALADAIEDLLIHEKSRHKLVDNAYSKAMEMFDIDKSVERVEELLA